MNIAGACRILFVFAAVLVLAGCSKTPPVKVVVDNDDFADLRQVQIYRAEDSAKTTTPEIKGIALLLGTEADWNNGSAQLASKMAANGWLVAGIHFDSFANARKTQNADCLDLVTLLDVFSQHLQQRYRIGSYQRPLLIGYKDGGSLAYLTLAQSSAGIFRGAVSLGLNTQPALPLPFCDHDGTAGKVTGGKLQLLPVSRVASRWSVWAATSPELHSLLQAMNTTHVHSDVISHEDDVDDWLGSALKDIDAQNDSGVADLPLIEMPASDSSTDYFAVIVSGDGGWANIDRDIGNALNARGIAVVGWNSLQYFWNRRTPQSSAEDLTRVLRHYRAQWRKQRVLLIGFSLGADVLPFMLSRMPQTDTADIISVALLSASSSVDFEFHVSNWIGSDNSNALKTAPELAKISALPVQCLYGSDDEDSVCRNLKAPAHWRLIELPGDHHFDGDYEKMAALIVENIAAKR